MEMTLEMKWRSNAGRRLAVRSVRQTAHSKGRNETAHIANPSGMARCGPSIRSISGRFPAGNAANWKEPFHSVEPDTEKALEALRFYPGKTVRFRDRIFQYHADRENFNPDYIADPGAGTKKPSPTRGRAYLSGSPRPALEHVVIANRTTHLCATCFNARRRAPADACAAPAC